MRARDSDHAAALELALGRPARTDGKDDWNGSAKVALLSIERSARALRHIAEATGDPEAAGLAERLAAFQAEVERSFPDAWRFIRPGFDEPGL